MSDPILTIAHITAPDGTIIQVLNQDGTDWDESLTQQAYSDYIASQPSLLSSFWQKLTGANAPTPSDTNK